MSVAQLLTKRMLQLFDDQIAMRPSLFLTSFFTTRPGNISNQNEVEIDIQRAGRRVSVDVIPGTGPRMNLSGRFKTYKYTPPMYDEADAVTGLEMLQRMAGDAPYMEKAGIAKLITKLVRKQLELTWMIERAWELQASQALFTGQISLQNAINGSATIDFGLRASHQITTTTAWSNAAADILGDIIALGKEVREDSGRLITDMVGRGTDIENILNNTVIKSRQQFRRSDRENFILPQHIGTGGTFHGVLTAGDLEIRLWSYEGLYDTESVSNNYYVPTDKVLFLSAGARFDKVFAGVPVLIPAANDPVARSMGLPAIPAAQAGEIVPYYQVDPKKRAIIAGISSRPLFIPTEIDSFGTIDTTP